MESAMRQSRRVLLYKERASLSTANINRGRGYLRILEHQITAQQTASSMDPSRICWLCTENACMLIPALTFEIDMNWHLLLSSYITERSIWPCSSLFPSSLLAYSVFPVSRSSFYFLSWSHLLLLYF